MAIYWLQNASNWLESHNGAITAIATIFIAIFTTALAVSTKRLWEITKKSVDLATEEFTAIHRPKITIRSCKFSTINTTGDHKYSCKFQCINSGELPAYIIEIGTRLINRDVCYTTGDREIIFDKNSSINEILASGAARIYFTSKDFDSDLIKTNWFFVGYIKYSDREDGGIIRETGFCRKWEPESMTWIKDNNEEYEYCY